MIEIPLRYVAPFMSLGIPAFLFLISIAEDVKCDIEEINEMAHRSHEYVYERFSNLIQIMSRKRFALKYKCKT